MPCRHYFSTIEKGLQSMKENALPIVPWIGGKRRLAKHILPLFPGHTCYVEPFCGAAALYFLKEPSRVEVINDVNNELVNLYRVVKHHLEEFVRQFKWALVSRQIYKWLQDTPEETLTDIQRAARFYYLQKQAFGGKVADHTFGISTTSAPRFNLLRIEEELSLAHLRLAIWTGLSALSAMTVRTRFSTATRHTGERKATAWIFHSRNMIAWRNWPPACRGK